MRPPFDSVSQTKSKNKMKKICGCEDTTAKGKDLFSQTNSSSATKLMNAHIQNSMESQSQAERKKENTIFYSTTSAIKPTTQLLHGLV